MNFKSKIREFFRGPQGAPGKDSTVPGPQGVSGISTKEVDALRKQWDADVQARIEKELAKFLPHCDCARCRLRFEAHTRERFNQSVSALASAMGMDTQVLATRLMCEAATELAQERVQQASQPPPQVPQPRPNVVSAVKAVPDGSATKIRSTGQIVK